jgi:hypothetical protein
MRLEKYLFTAVRNGKNLVVSNARASNNPISWNIFSTNYTKRTLKLEVPLTAFPHSGILLFPTLFYCTLY